MHFTYTALDPRGKKITDRVQAEDEDQAVRLLQSQGYVLLSVAPGDPQRPRAARSSFQGFPRLSDRVKLDQVVALTREFAILIETGVPVVEALETLQAHADNAAIREALLATHADLSQGKTMAQAMGAHRHVFPRLYVDMVRTAETGGSLSATLNQAADYLEAALEMRRKVVGALTYPAVLLCVALAVFLFMMTYLLPQFNQLFDRMKAEIPPTTRFLLAMSRFVKAHWWLIPIILIGSALGGRAFLRLPAGRTFLTRVLHRLPILGDIAKKVALARILRALGTLLGTGVSLLIALETAVQTSQDVIYEQALRLVREQVERGVSLSEAVAHTGVFPATICQIIAVGEKSGKLSAVLLRVAQFYERDVDARLKMLASIIEPVMIVVLGLMVGFIAVSILTPIYSLATSVK
ncbi:MAG TPA: type II secretion system F family protein [Chthonomonadaceae bacterium]|nr:type II secretion system F family protein [Chthonomonadaceae bacterium]